MRSVDGKTVRHRSSSLSWWLAAVAALAPALIPSFVWADDPVTASPRSAGQLGPNPLFELLEVGGSLRPKNLAAASKGARSFSLNDYGEHHAIDKLNDGNYGNPSTWIGGTDRSFAGVRFKQKEKIAAIAFGRDNSGKFSDRCLGRYCIQYTQIKNPDAHTPDDQWQTIATIDYAASPPPKPSRRHLFRFTPVDATAIRVVTQNDPSAVKNELGIDELEAYSPDDIAPARKHAIRWKPAFVDPVSPDRLARKWVNPLTKRGYLGSPLVEVTPLSFKGQLYLMECWRSRWKWDRAPAKSVTKQSEIWMAHLPDGPEHYDKRRYLGRVLQKCTLGSAIVWDDRVYVYAVSAEGSTGGRVVYMTWTEDMKTWSDPVKVFDSPAGKTFNVAVTRDQQGMVFLWEAGGYGRSFTMCYGRVKKPTDLWNPGIIKNARYGMHKYTGGPALYYENDWYYTLYLESLGRGRYETRITRSKDLKNWQDAPRGRPFVTFDPTRTGHPLRPKQTRETNASDAELCFHKGRTLIYFTGSDQKFGGDLQWATYDGTPSELLAAFFVDDAKTDLIAPKHLGDWVPVLIAPEDAKRAPARAPVETLRKHRPSSRQQAYQDAQLGAFIHFGPAAYVGGNMHVTPKADVFNPKELDANQWAKAAKSFGAKHVVLTAKHHNGYCLWPTTTTKYSVASSPWKDGKGDVVREFVNTCRKQGLRPGLYISGGDMHFKCHSTPEPMGKRHIVGDRDAYFKIFMQQLEELLTGYGPLAVIWFDGAYDPFGWDVMDKHGKRLGTKHRDAIVALVRKHQPGAVIFGSKPDVRWSGSEAGWAAYPLWNVVPKGLGHKNWTGPDVFGYILAEANLHTRKSWFWTANSDRTLMPVARLMQAYNTSVGRGANLLVNMTPDQRGLIPEIEIQRLADFGKEIHRQYGTPIARTDSRRGWTKGGILELKLEAKHTINRVVIEENLVKGQRVLAYELEARVDGEWRSLAKGLSIGRKRIHLFRPVIANRLRLRIVRAVDVPVISTFAAYSDPPSPDARQSGVNRSEMLDTWSKVRTAASAQPAFSRRVTKLWPVIYTAPSSHRVTVSLDQF